ncbi:hypothetical protein EQG64_34310 [Streptomyces sp. S6]|nr:hypothetical protein EQG64_34310 [Streptomyces sp. S6]
MHGCARCPGDLDIVYRLLAERGIEPGDAGLSDVLRRAAHHHRGLRREVTVLLEPDGETTRVTATSRVHDGAPADDGRPRTYGPSSASACLTGSPGPAGGAPPRDIGEVYTTGRSGSNTVTSCAATARCRSRPARYGRSALGARATADDFMLHPALLDGSTMQAYALAFAEAGADERPLIPCTSESSARCGRSATPAR